MRISLNHLKKYILDTEIEDISNILIQLGHEHEILDKKIFDIEFTPNRGDCLSVYGLSRDLKNHLNFVSDIDIYDKNIEELNINFLNKNPIDCSNISFLEIHIDGKKDTYSDYLESYFNDLKINKVNFFTDISNYLNYEIGHPTHCYDLSKISGEISFEKLHNDTSFKTIHGKFIDLQKNDNVFICNGNVIALAGIMGGYSTACDENTRSVLVECAYFNPESISGKATKYKLSSDAAYKFERGVDPLSNNDVLRRYIKIVEDHANIKSLKIKHYNFNKFLKVYLENDHERINTILGTNIERKVHNKILHNLGFDIELNKIGIPSYRTDIKNINDIAEEIARIVGYNNIKPMPIKVNSKKESNINSFFLQNIKSYFIKNNFYEVINNPFSSHGHENSIKVDNPLDSNYRFLRTNLKESLIKNLKYNLNRQHESIKLFEISNVYQNDAASRKIGLICSGRNAMDYENFSKNISINEVAKILSPFENYASIEIEKIEYSSIDVKGKGSAFYCEIELTKPIIEFFEENEIAIKPIDFFPLYKKVSDFPSSYRDISFAATTEESLNRLIGLIESFELNFLKEKFIFDYYVDSKNKIIKIGYRFIFQSLNKTLNDDEIDKEINKIAEKTLQINDISIPGM